MGADTNHTPTADRAYTLDGQAWLTPVPGDDPCVVGPRVPAGTDDHVIGNTTEGTDREMYTALLGDPLVPTPTRESLQISQFTTSGKLKNQFSFVEATDDSAETVVEVDWKAPGTAEGTGPDTASAVSQRDRATRRCQDGHTRRAGQRLRRVHESAKPLPRLASQQ